MSVDPASDIGRPQELYASGLFGVRNRRTVRALSFVSVGRNLWFICGLLVVTIFAAGGAMIWQLRQNALAGSQREMTNLGVVLAEQTSRSIQAVDLILQEIQSHTAELGLRTPEQFRLRLADSDTHQFLTRLLKNLRQADAVALIDANGALLNWSREMLVPHLDLSDRDYFRHLRDHDDPDAFISGSTEGRATGKWIMFIVRRINGPDGEFLGLVQGLIETVYLEDFYRTINMVPGESVTVLRRDGIVVAGHPDIENRRGKRMPAPSPWYRRVAEGGGSYRSPGYLTGMPQIITVHPLRAYPLVVDVNVSEQAALKGWYMLAAVILSAMIGSALGLAALFGVITAQFRRQNEQNVGLRQSASALRKSEQELKAYAEMSSEWFWEQDADLRFVRDSNIPLTTRPTDVGKTRWDFADSAMDQHRWDAHRADLVARRPFRDFRWERIGTDEKRHFMSTSVDPIFDDAGDFLGYHGTGRDITTEVAARDRAEQAETLLRDAVDSISAGLVIYDREDRFVMCNEIYRQIYVERADALIPGAFFKDILLHELANGRNEESRGREVDWLAERIQFHQEAKSSVERQQAHGTWILATDRRMKNGGIAGLRTDITAQKQAEAALHDSEAHLQRAQEIAGIGSWELDVATGRAIWSKELYRIRGFSPNEFQPNVDSNVTFIHPDDIPEVQQWRTDLAAGIVQGPRETRYIRPDGKVRLLRVEGRAVIDPDGVIRRLVGTMQDITEQRLIEQQLAQAQKMEAIGNLTGGMAHDFNNGLGVIIGNLDLLGRLIKAEPTANELCEEARDGALRCAELIRLLLAFARRQPLHPQKTNLNVLVESTAKLLGRTLGEDITITLHLGKTLPPVMADPPQLEAVLINLANNARDAMPRGGNLDIETETVELDAHYTALHPEAAPGMYVLIQVSDTGAGIAPEIISSIFEPFFTTKEAGQGTGMGLSMVFGFVKQSGGHLAVYSEPGKGTTFRIYLPPAQASDGPTATVADPWPVVGGNEMVLVVEDNVSLRRATVRQLAELGYQVCEAEDASAALAILSKGDPVDLLFSDVILPGTMDGLDLANHATLLRSGTRVLLTSGFPRLRGPDQRIIGCPFPLLNKPYRHDELGRALRSVLDGDGDHSRYPGRGSP